MISEGYVQNEAKRRYRSAVWLSPTNHDHGTHKQWTLLRKGHRLVRAITLLLRDEQQADGRKEGERKKKEDC